VFRPEKGANIYWKRPAAMMHIASF
jgi:hypothetical protein